MNDMNLYKITCVHIRSSGHEESKDIYVVAENPQIAEEKAMDKIAEKGWRYDDYVSNIKFMADSLYGVNKALLVI